MKRIRSTILHIIAFLPLQVTAYAQTRQQGFITITGAATCVTAGSCVQLPSLPIETGAVGIQITGTYTGTLSFEGTADGSNYLAAPACFSSSGQVTSTTTTGLFICSTGGLSGFQVRASAAVTGAASVVIAATNQPPAPSITSITGGTLAVTQGTSPWVISAADLATIVTLLQTPTGPQTAANSNAIVLSYNTLVSGAITSAMTGTTTTSLIGATASNYIYVTQCTTSNSSTTVPTDIVLQDGSGGTTLYTLPAPAGSGTGTGASGGSFTFPIPLKVPTAGNALFAANVTTSSSTKISGLGFKSTISY